MHVPMPVIIGLASTLVFSFPRSADAQPCQDVFSNASSSENLQCAELGYGALDGAFDLLEIFGAVESARLVADLNGFGDPGIEPPDDLFEPYVASVQVEVEGAANAATALTITHRGAVSMRGRDAAFQSAFGETLSRVVFTPFILDGGMGTVIPINLACDFSFTLTDDSTTGGNSGAASAAAAVSILGSDLEPVFNFDGNAQLDLDFDDEPQFSGDWSGIAISDPLGSDSVEISLAATFSIEETAGDVLRVESDSFLSIFSDGFESGDTSIWSSSSPNSFVIRISSPDPTVRFMVPEPSRTMGALTSLGLIALLARRRR